MLKLLAAVWAWALAHPQTSIILLATLTNAVVRLRTSPQWRAWCDQHPRVVGVFLLLKGIFPVLDTAWQGLIALATGKIVAASGNSIVPHTTRLDAEELHRLLDEWADKRGLPAAVPPPEKQH